MTDVATEYREHLEIRESTAVGTAGAIRDDGLVPIYVIRPGIGRGKGSHLYEADMLERNAGVFKGWRMFVDHQSPEAKRAGGGLPRSIRDLGGIIKESWWDPNVPADAAKGHGQGAVVALARPTPLIRQLIETDPALVEASISATATGVRPVTRGGRTVWLVEGLNPTGSVDWVSMAGAGGRVAQLAEALAESMTAEEEAMELFESMTDDEVLEHLRVSRPDLYKTVSEAAQEGAEETEETEQTPLDESTNKEEKVTKDEILEALQSDEGKEILEAAVTEQIQRIVAPKLSELVEAALEEEREVITAQAEARAERRLVVRDLREAAHDRIDATKLPDSMKAELRSRFDLNEAGEPTADLDVADDKDAAGKVEKTAKDKLTEAVDAAIDAKRKQVAEINPTAVRGQGRTIAETASTDEELGEDGKPKAKAEKEPVEEAKTTGSVHTDHLLEEAGVEVDGDLYAGIFQ